MRLLASLLAIAGLTSCAYDGPLQVWGKTDSTSVFFGKVTIGGEEHEGPGFIFGPMSLSWKGDKPLTLISLAITFPNSGKLSGEVNCVIDGTDLASVFALGVDLTVDPGAGTVNGGSLVCTGLQAINKNDQFIVTGIIKLRGYTGSAADQKLHRAENKMFLYWYPEVD